MTDLAARILLGGGTALFYVGQAGFILRSASGQLLGIDLYLSDCVERVEGCMDFKRLTPKLLSPRELKFDALIATHPHYDHFDVDAVPTMMECRRARFYASRNCKVEVERLGIDSGRCAYVRPGDEADTGDFHMEFVPCDHGDGAPDAVGAVVTVDEKLVYFTGDTCLRMDRVAEIREGRAFDVVVGPINGAYGNMDADGFAEYAHAIGARLSVPCHFGMFAGHGGAPGRFLEVMEERHPGDAVLLMAPGEALGL